MRVKKNGGLSKTKKENYRDVPVCTLGQGFLQQGRSEAGRMIRKGGREEEEEEADLQVRGNSRNTADRSCFGRSYRYPWRAHPGKTGAGEGPGFSRPSKPSSGEVRSGHPHLAHPSLKCDKTLNAVTETSISARPLFAPSHINSPPIVAQKAFNSDNPLI